MASPPRQIVIDDSDGQIHYSGSGWFLDQGGEDNVGNFGPTYKKTSHGTNKNDSFSFSFVGSSVTIWGTTNPRSIDNGKNFDPSWECFIDQINTQTNPFKFAENNWPICQQNTMKEGSHVITVNVTTTGNTFWFDYLTYTPSLAESYDTAVILVQNTDAAMQYDAGWRALGPTANMTTKVGSEVKFDFVGTSLSWIGFIPNGLPHGASTASYTIDNGPSMSFKLNGLPPTVTTSVYNQMFFTASGLAAGSHTIIVHYEGGDGPSTPLTVDYLLVTNISLPATASPTVTSSSIVTSSFHTSLFISTTTQSLTIHVQSNTPDRPLGHSFSGVPSSITTITPSSTNQSSSPHVGLIVGGVVGGLAAIVILLFAFRRWRSHRAIHIKSGAGFLVTGNVPSNLRMRQPQMTTTSRLPPPDPFTLLHPVGVDRSVVYPQAKMRIIPKVQNTPPAPTANVMVQQDSGIRLHSSRYTQAVIEDVPPMYTST